MSQILTIVIPTYNRNERLNKSLSLLLPQLQEYPDFCRLLFLDNCSPTPIAETLPEVFNSFPGIEYQIIRNKQNIGANANILRCFELCETEWTWCLSDDDPVAPDALTIIRQHLAAYPECVYFNFPYYSNRSQTYFTTGCEDFVNQLDLSANIPWMASAIHRTANIQVNLKYGYQFAYSMLPHVAMLLISLGTTGRCCISASEIMGTNNEPAAFENQWSIVTFALGAPIIYDLPIPFAARQALAYKMLVTCFGESIDLRAITIQLLLAYFKGNERTERFNKGNLRYNYDQIVYRNYYLRQRLGSRLGLRIAYYRLLVRFPHLAERLMHYTGNPMLSSVGRQDRYERV